MNKFSLASVATISIAAPRLQPARTGLPSPLQRFGAWLAVAFDMPKAAHTTMTLVTASATSVERQPADTSVYACSRGL